MTPSIRTKRGFTLLESILYISIFSVMVLLLGRIGIDMLLSRAKTHALETVGTNTSFLMEQIARDIERSAGITMPVAGNTATTLSLSMNDPDEDPVVFTIASSTIYRTAGSGKAIRLSSSAVDIDALTFTNISYPDTPGTVRTVMTIAAYNPEGETAYQVEETSTTTANVRITP